MDNNIKLFHLKFCPHCKKAIDLLGILQKENPEYAKIEVQKIDEDENKEFADSYDYHYVPCIFLGERKMFEGAMKKEDIKYVLDEYMKENQSVGN
ncbi:MAG TPA: thioredoxin family protein [Clostridia bacterium]|nr:thioredoxin family protein [Clostridia bacterium]